MPKGERRPAGIRLPAGREQAWELLHVLPAPASRRPQVRRAAQAPAWLRLPPDARTPLIIRENSTYNHEPTESSKGGAMPEWQHIHDNAFMHPGVAESRLGTDIREG